MIGYLAKPGRCSFGLRKSPNVQAKFICVSFYLSTAHFAALFPIVATDAAEGVIAELLTQIGFHRVQTFLRAEQVGVKGADALHDKAASLVPDIVPVEDPADA